MSKLKNYFKKIIERHIIIDNIILNLDKIKCLNKTLKEIITTIDENDIDIDIDSIEIHYLINDIDYNIDFFKSELNRKSKEIDKFVKDSQDSIIQYLFKNKLIKNIISILDEMKNSNNKIKELLKLLDKYDMMINRYVRNIDENIDSLKSEIEKSLKRDSEKEKEIKKDFELKHLVYCYDELENLGIKMNFHHYYYDAKDKLHIRCFDELTNILLEYFNEKIKNIENEINYLKKKTKSKKNN